MRLECNCKLLDVFVFSTKWQEADKYLYSGLLRMFARFCVRSRWRSAVRPVTRREILLSTLQRSDPLIGGTSAGGMINSHGARLPTEFDAIVDTAAMQLCRTLLAWVVAYSLPSLHGGTDQFGKGKCDGGDGALFAAWLNETSSFRTQIPRLFCSFDGWSHH